MYVQELEISAFNKTVEQCIESMFGSDLAAKIVVIKDGYNLGDFDGMRAVSEWWTPALTKRNGQLP